jgi:hypothetical protein
VVAISYDDKNHAGNSRRNIEEHTGVEQIVSAGVGLVIPARDAGSIFRSSIIKLKERLILRVNRLYPFDHPGFEFIRI